MEGQTHHMDVWMNFCEEEGILEVWWIPTDKNDTPSDFFTKNLDEATFAKHTSVYVRDSQVVTPKRGGCWNELLGSCNCSHSYS